MKGTHVRLGFELTTGAAVAIPVRHMCVTGQTQEAGKTTTLEALILRSELRALAFLTKRGEGAFGGARTVGLYFREQADWRFVSSMLEAFLGERMKFERSWIMRATKGARTLADVQRNIATLSKKAKGLSADVYMVLAEYLAELVPTIARVPWATAIHLSAGVNVMDVSDLPTSMQHLVIRSAIEYVLAHGRETVILVPEAWKFVPQGRSTPVKQAAMAYIRQGAALELYLWLDSQDIGGVDKELLRSCPVWLLGVQREANEIKRTLLNIPASVAKPKPHEIATLEVGQFVACWGKHTIRTYVQPRWLDDAHAIRIAKGEETVGDEYVREARPRHKGPGHDENTHAWFGRLTPEPARLVIDPKPPAPAPRAVDETAAGERFALARIGRFVQGGRRAQQAVDALGAGRKGNGDEMNADQERKLDTLVDTVSNLVKAIGRKAAGLLPDDPPAAGAVPRAWGADGKRDYAAEESLEFSRLYEAIKARLIEELPRDPRVIELVLSQPELRLKVDRPVLEVRGDTLQGRIALLIYEGWFDLKPKAAGDVQAELTSRGASTPAPNVARELAKLLDMGFLTRSGKWYRAVEIRKPAIHVDETQTARSTRQNPRQ